jgi:hypothetical protein
MSERGIEADHTTLYRWVQCYAPEMQGHLMNIHSAPDLVMLGLEKACFLQKNNDFF